MIGELTDKEFDEAFRDQLIEPSKDSMLIQDRFDEDYSFDACAEYEAKKRGLVVVLPKPNELQLDLDSEEAFQEFQRRFHSMTECDPSTIKYIHAPSVSGLPNRHVTIIFPSGKMFNEWERIALQAVLGSDIVREFLNAKRHFYGVTNPTRLFERP